MEELTMPNINISISENDSRLLEKKADALGLPLAVYIKVFITGDLEFVRYLKIAREEINNLKLQNKFTLRDLLKNYWQDMTDSQKRTIGIAFKELVVKKQIYGTVLDQITNGLQGYRVDYQEGKLTILEMPFTIKQKCKQIIIDYPNFSNLSGYSIGLKDYLDNVQSAISEIIHDREEKFSNNMNTAYSLLENSNIKLDHMVGRTLISYTFEPESYYLTEKLIEIQRICMNNYFKIK